MEGDVHAGVKVKHRSRVAVDPTQPDLRQVHLIEGPIGCLIMAIDGFWAELGPDQQTSFLHTGSRAASTEQDDCSALLISLAQTESVSEIHLRKGGSDGLYIRRLD